MTEPFAVIRDLAEGVSKQAAAANRTWLALAAVSTIALLPPTPDSAGHLEVPFLGTVDGDVFHVVLAVLVAVFCVGFATAHAQLIRSLRLSHRAVRFIKKSTPKIEGQDPEDLWDAFRIQNYNRVAPLVSILHGLDSFRDAPRPSPAEQRLSKALYLYLKTLSLLAYWGLPFWALWSSSMRAPVSWQMKALLLIMASSASAPMALVLIRDSNFVREVARRSLAHGH